MRRNAGLWLGLLLALPIPILALASSGPFWIDVISLTAPIAWAAILGAAGRVARLGDDEIHRMAAVATTVGHANEAEKVVARGVAADAIQRIRTEASKASRAHAAESVVLRGAADSERTERERLELLQGLMETELALAQRVHRSLLPENILRPDLEVVVRQIPCSYVGGDYLHAALPRPDLLYLCVGDVVGHGVSAALVVSRIHGLMQNLILEQRMPDQILEHLDRATTQIVEHTPFFMTFAVFRVDLGAARIDYAMAGHPNQYLLRSEGTVEHLTSGNGLLGLKDLNSLGPMRPASVQYRSGDTLVLFTDGLFEVAARDGGPMLGEAGLLSRLARLAKSTPELVVSDILQSVVDFGHLGPFEDDVSLMVARFGAPSEPVRPGQRRDAAAQAG